MIKIVVNGALGRMGTEVIRQVDSSEKFELIGGIDAKPGRTESGRQVVAAPAELLPQADVVIDFSLPPGAMSVLRACREQGTPLVSGTTGLDAAQMREFQAAASEIPIVQAFNFSIGINLLLQLAGKTAEVLQDQFDAEIVETHHRMKKDSPSGTAVLLANRIAEKLNLSPEKDIRYGRHGKNLERGREIGVHSLRGGSVIGEHQVSFLGENENLLLTHQALNRKIFVDGALLAAEWILPQENGLYGMGEVLGF